MLHIGVKLPSCHDGLLPWCGAGEWFTRGLEEDKAGDDGEEGPHHQEADPVELDAEHHRDEPHAQQCCSLKLYIYITA